MVRERIYRYAPSNYQLNKKIKKLQRDPELKFYDRWINFGSVTTNSVIAACNDVGSGISQVERDGNEIRCTSLEIRGYAFINNLETVVQKSDLYRVPLLRMLVFWDRSPNNDMPQLIGNSTATEDDSVLDNTDGADPVFLPYNRNTIDRFRVLYDKTFRFPQSPYVISGGYGEGKPDVNTVVPHLVINKRIKLSRKTRYSGPDPDYSDISENGLYVAFISTYDTDSGQNYAVSVDILTRVNFYDD